MSTSFSNLVSARGMDTPPSLPLSGLSYSPPSDFAVLPGFSPSQLFNSPILTSPTTNDQNNYPDFAFHQQSELSCANDSQSQFQDIQAWSFEDIIKQSDVPFTNNIPNSQIEYNNNNNTGDRSFPFDGEHKTFDDGYNWLKYGQKQVKRAQKSRSYYKCAYLNCPTKRMIDHSLLHGQITAIIYKGNHNHPPQFTRRSSSIMPHNRKNVVCTEQYHLLRNSKEVNSDKENEFDWDEPHAKRWKMEGENETTSALGTRTVRSESRVVIQTTSDSLLIDDGYKWRKCGEKVVKENPNPRSYYKCSNPGCQVRKQVERASQDIQSVITTYKGKHDHNVPMPPGSGAARRADPNQALV